MCAHMIETMAYTGEVPWHGLGTAVNPNLTPEEMLNAAGLNWQVERRQIKTDQGIIIPDQFAFVRDIDKKPLSIGSKRFIPVQNLAGIEFFNRFVEAGRMSMETMGSLDDGKRVWALARMKKGDFALANDDQIISYLLFCNPHVPGRCAVYMFTPTRVVCHNTLTMALNAMDNSAGVFKFRHSRDMNSDIHDEIELVLGLSAEKMKSFRESAEFLSSKRITDSKLSEFFVRIFQPEMEVIQKDAFNRNVIKLHRAYDVQPGKNMSDGTWWTAFNAVTYFIDHHAGRNQNNRIRNAWFGKNAQIKREALTLALDYAGKSKAA